MDCECVAETAHQRLPYYHEDRLPDRVRFTARISQLTLPCCPRSPRSLSSVGPRILMRSRSLVLYISAIVEELLGCMQWVRKEQGRESGK